MIIKKTKTAYGNTYDVKHLNLGYGYIGVKTDKECTDIINKAIPLTKQLTINYV